MVQQGGNQDDIRLSIIIDTIARLQALDATKASLEGLSQRFVQNRNALGQFAQGMKTELDPALKDTGKRLGQIITEGFGPRFINSIQGVNQAFIRSGQTIKRYVIEAQAVNAVSPQVANGLNFISQGMTAVGMTGRASTTTIAQLREQLAALHPVTQADVEIISALNVQLGTLGTQTVVAAEQQAARLNRQLTGTQKAGQGMLLSFALTQAAAGRLSQAMFGLGFAVIFTGLQFLNFITVLTAVSLALAAIALDKLQNRLSAADKITESVTKTTEKYADMLTVVKGEAKLTGEALADMMMDTEDGAEAFIEYGKALQQAEKNQRSFLESTMEAARFIKWLADLPGEAIIKAAEAIVGGRKEETWVERLITEWKEDAKAAFIELWDVTKQGIEGIQAEFDRAAQLELALAPIRTQREEMEREFEEARTLVEQGANEARDLVQSNLEAQITTRRRALQTEIDAIRDASSEEIGVIRDTLENQIRLRRRALDKELSAIREAADAKIEIIRDNLEAETDVIRERTAEKVDLIRKGLDAETEAIRDALDDRIDTIRDKAKDEISAERDKIKELTSQERELESVLRDLQSERERIRAAIFGSEAELAALEREAALVGVGATEEQAIIKARIDGLRAEGSAIDDAISQREAERSGIQQQIDTIEDLIERIEDARDSAIEAARDEADARIDASRDAAQEQIKAVNKARDRTIDAAQDTTDAQIKAINKATDRSVLAARDRSDADVRAAQRSANEQINQAQRASRAAVQAAQDRSAGDVKAYRQAANEQITQINRLSTHWSAVLRNRQQREDEFFDSQVDSINKIHETADRLNREVIPALKTMVGLQIAAGVFAGNLNKQLVESTFIYQTIASILGYALARSVMESLGFKFIGTTPILQGLPSPGLGYQLGTRAVPGAIGQPQYAIVHGGERITPPEGIESRVIETRFPALPPPSEKVLVRDIYMTINVRNEADIERIKRIVNSDMGRNVNTTVRRGAKTFRSRKVDRTFGER